MERKELLCMQEDFSSSKQLLLCVMCMKRKPKIILKETGGEVSIKLECSCFDKDNTLLFSVEDYICKLRESRLRPFSKQTFCKDCNAHIDNEKDYVSHKVLHRELILNNYCQKHQEILSEYYCKDCSESLCQECFKNTHSKHSSWNFFQEASDINISKIYEKLERAAAQFNSNLAASKEFISDLDESTDNDKEVKNEYWSMIENKTKTNNALAALSLLILSTHSLLSPLINSNMVHNTKLIIPNDKELKLAYDNDEDNIKEFTSYYNYNYLLHMSLENGVEQIKMKEEVNELLVLRNGDVALLTQSGTMLRYDSNLISLICKITQKPYETAYYLIELANRKLIAKESKEKLIIWDFAKLSCELHPYPTSYKLKQLSSGLLFSSDWSFFLYNIDTMQIITEVILGKHDSIADCLELSDGRMIVADHPGLLYFLNNQFQIQSRFKVNEKLTELTLLNDGLFAGISERDIMIIDLRKMIVVNCFRTRGSFYYMLVSPNQRLFYCTNRVEKNKEIAIVDTKTLKLLKQIPIGKRIDHFGILKDGRLAINDKDIFLYDMQYF